MNLGVDRLAYLVERYLCRSVVRLRVSQRDEVDLSDIYLVFLTRVSSVETSFSLFLLLLTRSLPRCYCRRSRCLFLCASLSEAERNSEEKKKREEAKGKLRSCCGRAVLIFRSSAAAGSARQSARSARLSSGFCLISLNFNFFFRVFFSFSFVWLAAAIFHLVSCRV